MIATELGTVLSLAGTSILNGTYTAGSTIYAGRPDRIRFYVKSVVVAGTLPTSQVAKVQACDGDTSVAANWYDVESEDDTDEIAEAPMIEHTLTLGASGTFNASYSVSGKYRAVRLAVKWTGNAGETNESVVATAIAS